MTDVVSGHLPADHQLTAVRHYEAGPPEGLELVEPGETYATTKEEEWVSKKKTEVTNTKQIETRVKRQVVLEDGKVVEDTGPMVTTNTTEDSETQEHHQTELRKLGADGQNDGQPETRAIAEDGDRSDWVAVPNSDGIVREVKEKKVVSREETEEVKETEDVQHLGDITDEDFLNAVRTDKNDLRPALKRAVEKNGLQVVSTGPRIIRDTYKSRKVTDSEDTRESSAVQSDGKIITETQRTTEHEEVDDDELPKDQPDINLHKESSQRYFKAREQEDVDYLADGVRIGREMRFRNETMEAERHGDNGLDDVDFDSLSARMRRRSGTNRRDPAPRYRLENGTSPLDRKDALTRRPLDFDAEEETRKHETNKWLEHHFGSDSKSSNNSLIDEEDEEEERRYVEKRGGTPPKQSFFNVTIKSSTPTPPPPPQPPQKSYVTTVNSVPERDYDTTIGQNYYKGVSEWSERRRQHHRERVTTQSPTFYDGPDYRCERTPTPPQRRRHQTAPRREVELVSNDMRYDRRMRPEKLKRDERDEIEERPPFEEPPPDYSPSTPPPPPHIDRKPMQKTRFAPDPPKKSGGNIIGQSIRKLVGKIRSASAERKARQKAKRSPSPSYQKGHIIDNIGHHQNGNGMDNGLRQPVQRYYLGEDPFAGSIYGRENKYDGVKPARNSRRQRIDEEHRSQSTLGRFSRSTGRLAERRDQHAYDRTSHTLPRQPVQHRIHPQDDDESTINVSIINTVASAPRPFRNEGPAKPARTYRSNLARSKSLNANHDKVMYNSNPLLHRLDASSGEHLKSPGLISSLSRSQRDLNAYGGGRRRGSPERFEPVPENDYWRKDVDVTPIGRRPSNSSTDYSETYHTTTRNDDPIRPSVTNTVTSFTKKTIPARDGRCTETIESSETKSVTKSHFKGRNSPGVTFYETSERRYGGSPVVIEVRNSGYRK